MYSRLSFILFFIFMLSACSSSSSVEIDNPVTNSAPTASDVDISDDNGGVALVGDGLTGGYTYADAENDLQGISTFQWFRNGIAISGETATTYTITMDDDGQNITFAVTPIAQTGTLTGSTTTSTAIMVSNSAPTASGVGIADDNGGITVAGDSLTGSYTYDDTENDLQGTSTFQWFRNGLAISGETDLTYTLVAADSGQTITFAVTPVAQTGTITGVTVTSAGMAVVPSFSDPVCKAGTGVPPASDIVALEPVFTNINFNLIMGMVQSPDPADNRWFAMERAGVVRAFPDDYAATDAQTSVVLDISGSVSQVGEGGLLGIAFHPDYGPSSDMTKNGYVFLSYIHNNGYRSRVSRFTMNAARTSLDPTSELVLIDLYQPDDNHNGGNIGFGHDGYLYIGFGDGGGSDDQYGNGQTLSTLHSNMLRIDVDNPATGANYGIPLDNPYYDAVPTCLDDGFGVGVCSDERLDGMTPVNAPEIFASGFRNPWRWSFDINPADPDVSLWVGDVGQDLYEEVDLVINGANYGWNTMEGFNCFSPSVGCDMTGLSLPVVEYEHVNSNLSITGGFVYRGSEIPSLYGAYIYGDFGSSRVWRLNNPYTAPVAEELFQAGGSIVSFAQSRSGEIFVIDFGLIQKLVTTTPAAAFPNLLSETGCADAADPKLPTAGMLPFEINSLLWSDGADKFRWLATPSPGITIEADLDWSFPADSVLRKDFYLGGRIIETRLLANHTNGFWRGYSYEWNVDETEATLVAGGKTVSNIYGLGQDWVFPSSADCGTCHTSVAGVTLGPETIQLNRAVTGILGTGNQLDLMSQAGLFANTLPDIPSNLPALADHSVIDLMTASPTEIEQAARAYLHSNCSGCHRLGGTTTSSMDLRSEVTLANMNVCEAPIDDLGIVGAQLIDPMNPANSMISIRMKESFASGNRMPLLGSLVVDGDGTALIDAWINNLATCP